MGESWLNESQALEGQVFLTSVCSCMLVGEGCLNVSQALEGQVFLTSVC